MKKTVLSLALVTLTVGAFANTSLYSTDTTNVYVDGSFYTNVAKVKDTDASVEANLKANFGFDIKVPDAASAGINIALENLALPATEADSKYKGNFYSLLAHFKADHLGLYPFKSYSAYFDYPTIGTVTFGKGIDTVGSSLAVGSDLNSDAVGGLVNNAFAYLTDTSDFDEVIRYDSFTQGGFQISYSYAHTTDAAFNDTVYNDLHNNSASLSYAFDYQGHNVATAYMSFTKGYNASVNPIADYVRTFKANTYQFSLTNDGLYDGLSLTAAFAFGNSTSSLNNTSVIYTGPFQNSRSFMLKGSYVYNNYIQPYAGLSFVKANATLTSTEKSSTTKVQKRIQEFDVYAGINSDLYTYKFVDITAFAEGAISSVSTSTYVKTQDHDYQKQSNDNHELTYGVATGISFNF